MTKPKPPGGAKKKISYLNKEAQKYELISIDAMFPGAVKLLNKGFLNQEDLEINNLTTAAQPFGFRSLWSVPEDDGSPNFMSIVSEDDSIKNDSNILEYRIALTHSDDFDVVADDKTERFVVDVAYPPSYPPAPPFVKIYTNFTLTPQQRGHFVDMCRATILDSHPLFQERIIPLCDIVVERIKLCRDMQTDAWSELSFKRTKENGVVQQARDAPTPTQQDQTPQPKAISELIEAQSRFHADVLKELGLSPDTKTFAPSSNLPELTPSNESLPLPGQDILQSEWPVLEETALLRRSPIDFYTYSNILENEEDLSPEGRTSDVPNIKSKALKRRRRRETISSYPGEGQDPVLQSSVTVTRTGTSRIETDFHMWTAVCCEDDYAIPALKVQGPVSKYYQRPKQGVLSLTAVNQIDKFKYNLTVIRIGFIATALDEFNARVEMDSQAIALHLKSTIQAFSHTDNPHLGRINSVWIDYIPAAFIKKFISTQSTVVETGRGREICVCVQSENLDNLTKVNSYNQVQGLVKSDPLLPVKISEQALEIITMLHRHKFAFLQDFEALRLEVDDLGFNLKLPGANVSAAAYITFRQNSDSDEKFARAIARLLGLPTPLKEIMEEHSKVCTAACKTPTNACPQLLAIDIRLFCVFFVKFVKRVCIGNIELPEEAKPFLTEAERTVKTPLKDVTTALDLLEKVHLTRPTVNRQILKDFLYQTANPTSPEGMLAVHRLFNRQHFNVQPDLFLFNSKEFILSQFWDDNLASHIAYHRKMRDEILEMVDKGGKDDEVLKDVVKDLLDSCQSMQFSTFTETFLTSSVLYKDVITANFVGSFAESISAWQVDLPSLLAVARCISASEYTGIVRSMKSSAIIGRHRGIRALYTIDFLGLAPEDPTSTYLTESNFLIHLPKSLWNSLMASRMNAPVCNDRVAEQPLMCIQNVYRPGEQYGHPVIALRFLLYSNCAVDEFPGVDFAPWGELCVSLGVLFQPFLKRLGTWRLVISFPRLLRALVRALEPEASESRAIAIIQSLCFGTPLGDEYRDIKSLALYENLLRASQEGSTPISRCLDVYNALLWNIENPECHKQVNQYLFCISQLRDFFNDIDFCGIDVFVDLFEYPAPPAADFSSSLFFTIHHSDLEDDSLILGCGAVNPSQGLWWTEISMDVMARFINSHEMMLAKEGKVEETYLLSHLCSPRVLILMQRSNCELSLSLLSRLQFVGVKADCLVVPLVNMSALRDEIPKTSLGVLFLVMVTHRDATHVVYKVDSLVPAEFSVSSPSHFQSTSTPSGKRSWRSETLNSENAAFAHILSHISKTKSTIRSAVLRECSKFGRVSFN